MKRKKNNVIGNNNQNIFKIDNSLLNGLILFSIALNIGKYHIHFMEIRFEHIKVRATELTS